MTMKMEKDSGLLSPEGIPYLFSLEVDNQKKYDVNLNLQILQIKPCGGLDKAAKEICSCTMTDMHYNYGGFIIVKKKKTINFPKRNDIITILELSSMMFGDSKNRVFLIQDYKVYKTKMSLLYPDTISYNTVFNKEQNADHTQENNQEVVDTKNQSEEGIFDINKPEIETVEIASKHEPLSQLTTFSKDFNILVRVKRKVYFRPMEVLNHVYGGAVLSFIAEDTDKTTIQIVSYGKTAEKYNNVIREGSIYQISKGLVKLNDNTARYPGNDYKIILSFSSVVKKVEDDEMFIDEKVEITSLSEIPNLKVFQRINVLVYITEIEKMEQRRIKRDLVNFRKIKICDLSGYSMSCSLWRNLSEMEMNAGDVLLIVNAVITEFNNIRRLTNHENTFIRVNPREYIEEVKKLKEYCSTNKGHFKSLILNNIRSPPNFTYRIDYINDIFMGLRDPSRREATRKKMFRIKATIIQMLHGPKNIYIGCPNEDCRKKLSEEQEKKKICGLCKKPFKQVEYYFIVPLRVMDCSSEVWIDVLGGLGEELLGMTPCEYKSIIKEGEKSEKVKAITKNVEFNKFYFYVRPKVNLSNNSIKRKLSVFKIERIAKSQEKVTLLKHLKETLK